jgi:hypothetical protein
LACFIHKIGLVGVPFYVSSLLVLGRSSRHRVITVLRLAPSNNLRGDSTVYQCIRLWNVLSSATKPYHGMSIFDRDTLQFLSALEAFKSAHQNHNVLVLTSYLFPERWKYGYSSVEFQNVLFD